MKKLTFKQKRTLEAIEYFIKENGYSPTYRELAKLLGYSSTATIYELCFKLESKGYIESKPCKQRTIRVLRSVENEK